MWVLWLAACGDRSAILVPIPSEPSGPEISISETIISDSLAQTVEKFVVGEVVFFRADTPGEATTLAVGDLNQDGHLDLVMAREPELSVLLGNGEGGLQPFSRAYAGQQPDDLAIADINGDGAVDILVANHDTQYLTILLGVGRGTFQPAANSPLYIDVHPHPHAVEAVDLDGDGVRDLVIDHREGEGLLILRGLGGGRFANPGMLVEVGGDPYRGLAVGDINGDGKPDLVTPNPGEIGVLVNRSGDEIAFARASDVPAEAPFAVGLGDFNGDGALDILTASGEGSTQIELIFGDGSGGFGGGENHSFQLARGGKNLVLGDFNGDGIHDAAVASYRSSEVLVLLGGRSEIQTGYLPGGEHPWGMAAGDFNGDGKDDLVIVDDASAQAKIFLTGTQ
jgi:hypothetical protein